MAYETIFDVAQNGFRAWIWIAAGLGLTAFGALFLAAPGFVDRILPSGLQGTARRIFGWAFVLFALIWTVTVAVFSWTRYSALRDASASGTCTTAEGAVTDFEPQIDKQDEAFRVAGVTFRYNDASVTGGYNATARTGGAIREGMLVRICYVPLDGRNIIVRLDVAKGS